MSSPMMERCKNGGFFLVALTIASLIFAGSAVVGAEKGGGFMTLEARLIMASDNNTAPASARKLDAASLKRFYCYYKWTNFYLVKKKRFALTALSTRKVLMTQAYEMEVKDLGLGRLECKLFREGKLLGTQTSKLEQNGGVIFGGDTSSHDAWFVSLRFPPEDGSIPAGEARASQTSPPGASVRN